MEHAKPHAFTAEQYQQFLSKAPHDWPWFAKGLSYWTVFKIWLGAPPSFAARKLPALEAEEVFYKWFSAFEEGMAFEAHLRETAPIEGVAPVEE